MTTAYTIGAFRTLSTFAGTLPSDHEFNLASHLKGFEEKCLIINKFVLEKINLALQVYEEEDWHDKDIIYERLLEYQTIFQELTEEPTRDYATVFQDQTEKDDPDETDDDSVTA